MLKHYWALIGKRLANYLEDKWPEHSAAWASTLGLGVCLPSVWLATATNPVLLIGTRVYEWLGVGDGEAAVAAAEAIIHDHQSSRPQISSPTKR